VSVECVPVVKTAKRWELECNSVMYGQLQQCVLVMKTATRGVCVRVLRCVPEINQLQEWNWNVNLRPSDQLQVPVMNCKGGM